ncbi:MAG: molybdopterin-binding protein [Nitriliruptoraceae bacterium]
MLEASMVAIGDELLGGYVADANSPWLAQRLRSYGVPLSRVHVVPDEFAAIDEALQAELARSRPRLVVTSGGVGSTPDDITFEAVAASLGRDVVLHDELAARLQPIADRTATFGIDVDERFTHHLLRMARLPSGSRLLTPPGSWVPAVAVDIDGGSAATGVTVLILPGVPEAFRSLVSNVVEPQLLAGHNPNERVEEITHSFPESVLNGMFEDLLRDSPAVKLGSYPGRPMIIRLTGPPDDVNRAAEQVRAHLQQLTDSPAGARLAASWAVRGQRANDAEDAT